MFHPEVLRKPVWHDLSPGVPHEQDRIKFSSRLSRQMLPPFPMTRRHTQFLRDLQSSVVACPAGISGIFAGANFPGVALGKNNSEFVLLVCGKDVTAV
eukprot:scaffold4868_cov416-Prasinococcus_capsulatus_cf.AAC.28